MEPCSVFFNLESDYLEIKREVNKDLNELSIKVQDNDLKNKINMLLHEAQRTVQLMKVEARGKVPSARKVMDSKINVYMEEVKGLHSDFQKTQLIQGSGKHRLEKASEQLHESQKLVAETEAVGIAVLDQLAGQRESLLSSKNKVKETNAFTNEAETIITRMTKRLLANKIVLYTIILFLSVAILVTMYFDFFSNH